MQINSILLNDSSSKITNKKINNKKPSLSFCADIKPTLTSDTAEIFPKELSHLMKKRNSLVAQIKKADYGAKTKEIFREIINIQENANLSQPDKMSFDSFQIRLQTQSMRPLREAFESFEKHSDFADIKEIFGKNDDLAVQNGGAFFISKDKNLADDVAFLYPFYTKAKWCMRETLPSIYSYYDMMHESYCFDTEILNAPIYNKDGKTIADENIEYLGKKLQESQKNHELYNRPTLLLTKSLDSMIDKDKNSPESISHMKYILNQSCPEYGAFFLGGAPNPMAKSTEKGIMKSHRISTVVDLDELGVEAKHVEFLKKAQDDLGSFVDKISSLFRKFTKEDEKAFVGEAYALSDLADIDEEIVDKYCLPEFASGIKERLEGEYISLMQSRETESFMQTKEFMSMLDSSKMKNGLRASKGAVEEAAFSDKFENSVKYKETQAPTADSIKGGLKETGLQEAGVLENSVLKEAAREAEVLKEAGTIKEAVSSKETQNITSTLQDTVKTTANNIAQEAQNQIKQSGKNFSKNKAFAIVVVIAALLGGGIFLFKKYFHKFFKK